MSYPSQPDQDPDKQAERLKTNADHLADFGTITSLGSSAFYFIEQAMGKRIPRWLNNLSLGSIGVGMGAVFSSFYLRHKATKLTEGQKPEQEPKTQWVQKVIQRDSDGQAR